MLMNKKKQELINLIFKKLNNYQNGSSKINKREVEEFIKYLIKNN